MNWRIGRSKPWTDNAEHRSCTMDYFGLENGIEIPTGCECSERKRIWDEAQANYPKRNVIAALEKSAANATRNSKKQLWKLLKDSDENR